MTKSRQVSGREPGGRKEESGFLKRCAIMNDESWEQHPASNALMSSCQNQYRPTPGSASEELKQSEAKLRTIIDTIPVIAWWALPDGSGEFWNRRWHDYTGLSLETARGWGWRAAIHPDDLE